MSLDIFKFFSEGGACVVFFFFISDQFRLQDRCKCCMSTFFFPPLRAHFEANWIMCESKCPSLQTDSIFMPFYKLFLAIANCALNFGKLWNLKTASKSTSAPGGFFRVRQTFSQSWLGRFTSKPACMGREAKTALAGKLPHALRLRSHLAACVFLKAGWQIIVALVWEGHGDVSAACSCGSYLVATTCLYMVIYIATSARPNAPGALRQMVRLRRLRVKTVGAAAAGRQRDECGDLK